MSYGQLKAYIQNTKVTGYKTSSRLLTQLHQKLSSPFICFIMLLVAAPLALKMRRGGAMISIGVGLFIIVTYYSVIAFISALGMGGIIPPVAAAWMPNGLFLLVGFYLVRKNI